MKYDFLLKRLKDIREDNELTQADMAEILKTSQSNYSRWEKNTKFIPLKKLNSFCNYFCVSMDYVVGFTNHNSCESAKSNLNKKIIADRIKQFRKEQNITQMQLANFLNTSQSTISAYESGETLILTVFAIEICSKYKISLDWLCGKDF